MVSKEKFKQIREKYEKVILKLFDELDPSGYNSEVYRNTFKTMSDTQFIELCKTFVSKDDFIFSLEINEMDDKHSLTLNKIKEIADKYKVKLVEYVFMPFRNPKGKPMCTLTRIPIVYCQVRRFFQQMLQHKNAISNNNTNINPLTGQVINEDKTASTTNIQTYALTVTNRNNALKEYLGPRADDIVAKQDMLTQIEKTGRFRLEDTNMQTHNRQSINTAEVFAKAAGIIMEFSGNDYTIDVDNL